MGFNVCILGNMSLSGSFLDCLGPPKYVPRKGGKGGFSPCMNGWHRKHYAVKRIVPY